MPPREPAADLHVVRQQGGDLVESLDQLLGSEEQHGTFHDAEIVDIAYDVDHRAARFTARLCVGDPDAAAVDVRERRREGVLELRGISAWQDERTVDSGRWLADDGPIAQAFGATAEALVKQLRKDEIGWYFYFADSNSFLYWTAAEASFRWLGGGEPAA